MKPSAIKVLNYLVENYDRFVPSTELADNVCLDYRKRISELRKHGYEIHRKPVPGKPYSAYMYISSPRRDYGLRERDAAPQGGEGATAVNRGA
jgi:hypothetical protein